MTERKKTRPVKIGGLTVGGGNPIAIQSMLNAQPEDVEGNIRQARELEDAGCDIIRVAVPGMEDVRLLGALKEAVSMPVVADIQFNYRLAVESAYAGADKVRINPGNIGDEAKIKAVVDACRANGIPIRIGVNSGSLEKEVLAKYQSPTADALVESALLNVRCLEKYDFYDYLVAIKSSDVSRTIEAYRKFSQLRDCPLHLGVTEAGTERMGLVKSAIALGSLLCDGIGDTLRVSLTAPPVREIYAAQDILKGAGLWKKGPRFVSCPTCGRCKVDLLSIADQVENALRGCTKDLKIAIMGCVVNGPGEARDADLGVAGGPRECIIFRKGEQVRTVPREGVVEALLEEVEAF